MFVLFLRLFRSEQTDAFDRLTLLLTATPNTYTKDQKQAKLEPCIIL
jgi:hypothetical protein